MRLRERILLLLLALVAVGAVAFGMSESRAVASTRAVSSRAPSPGALADRCHDLPAPRRDAAAVDRHSLISAAESLPDRRR